MSKTITLPYVVPKYVFPYENEKFTPYEQLNLSEFIDENQKRLKEIEDRAALHSESLENHKKLNNIYFQDVQEKFLDQERINLILRERTNLTLLIMCILNIIFLIIMVAIK